MNVADFTYDLPDELIAQYPPEKRGASRLLKVRRDQTLVDANFAELLLSLIHI